MVHGGEDINWTEIETLDQYRSVVAVLRAHADREGETLSRWEAAHYRRSFGIKVFLPTTSGGEPIG